MPALSSSTRTGAGPAFDYESVSSPKRPSALLSEQRAVFLATLRAWSTNLSHGRANSGQLLLPQLGGAAAIAPGSLVY